MNIQAVNSPGSALVKDGKARCWENFQQLPVMLVHPEPTLWTSTQIIWFFYLHPWILFSFVVVVQLPARVKLFTTPWTAAHQASLSPTISWSFPKFMSIALVMPSNHLILCCPLFFLPSIFPSIRAFSNKLALCITWPKYWSFSFSIRPFNECSELTSFKIDWFDLLDQTEGTLKSLLQHHSSKTSVLWCSAFFIVRLSPPHVTTGKTTALTISTFVGKVIFAF